MPLYMKIMETHPLNPFLPENAKLLMLGSFPPPRARWSMDFYYPNMQNDMWRIFGLVFFSDKAHFLNADGRKFDREKIIAFLEKAGIALGDTAREVTRLNNNASDKFLEVESPIDLAGTLGKIPHCESVAVTGQKAADTILKLIECEEPKVGSFSRFEFLGRKMRLWRMPSSSRAYPLAIEKKAESYAKMLRDIDIAVKPQM